MRKSNYIYCLPALLLLLALTACGGGGSSDPAAENITTPVFGTDVTGASFIGVDRCLACHNNVEVLATYPGVDPQRTYAFTQSYLASAHSGQGGTVAATADPACLSCHDPLGDGRMLATGTAAVGCENCHGAGPLHLTMIPNHPNPVPDFNVCGKCHGALPSSVAAHGTGIKANILAAYQQSAHPNTTVTTTYPFCARCHSDEVFRLYSAETAGMDSGQLAAFFNGRAPLPTRSPIQCRTCHNSHDGSLRAAAITAVENGRIVLKYSRQFNLCTACHEVFLSATFDPASGTYRYLLDTSKVPFHGTTDSTGKPKQAPDVIWDSHFATADGGIIGYSINPASEHACVVCHDPHGATKFF